MSITVNEEQEIKGSTYTNILLSFLSCGLVKNLVAKCRNTGLNVFERRLYGLWLLHSNATGTRDNILLALSRDHALLTLNMSDVFMTFNRDHVLEATGMGNQTRVTDR